MCVVHHIIVQHSRVHTYHSQIHAKRQFRECFQCIAWMSGCASYLRSASEATKMLFVFKRLQVCEVITPQCCWNLFSNTVESHLFAKIGHIKDARFTISEIVVGNMLKSTFARPAALRLISSISKQVKLKWISTFGVAMSSESPIKDTVNWDQLLVEILKCLAKWNP